MGFQGPERLVVHLLGAAKDSTRSSAANRISTTTTTATVCASVDRVKTAHSSFSFFLFFFFAGQPGHFPVASLRSAEFQLVFFEVFFKFFVLISSSVLLVYSGADRQNGRQVARRRRCFFLLFLCFFKELSTKFHSTLLSARMYRVSTGFLRLWPNRATNELSLSISLSFQSSSSLFAVPVIARCGRRVSG